MQFVVRFHPDFEPEFDALSEAVREALLQRARLLQSQGPLLGRPNVDNLQLSRYPRMKELRFNADGGVWRVAFAFDANRDAVLLAAGDKSGIGERRFYRQLLEKADQRYAQHATRSHREGAG